MIKPFVLFILAYVLLIFFTPFIFIIKLSLLRNTNYIWTCAIGIDQAGGSILYNEKNFTISSYTYWICKNGNMWACDFMKIINFVFGKDHCERSYYREINENKKEIERRTL